MLVNGQTSILIHQKSKSLSNHHGIILILVPRDTISSFTNNLSKHFTLSDEDCESQSKERGSFSTGAGCLPCTSKSRKKNLEKISKQICKQF